MTSVVADGLYTPSKVVEAKVWHNSQNTDETNVRSI